MRLLTFASLGCLISTLLLSGCALVKHAPGPVVGAEKQTPRQIIEQSLAEDSPEKAHAALRDALRGGATENSLAEVYTKVENRLLGEAGRAEGGSHFGAAGRFYRMALDLYPKSPQIRSTLVMTEEALQVKIDECADALMKRGLVAYRAGKLPEAVVLWEKITLFSPEYSPSKVAIQTAKQQIENLERLSPAKAN